DRRGWQFAIPAVVLRWTGVLVAAGAERIMFGWFKKKIKITIETSEGGRVVRRVPEAHLDEFINQGLMKRVVEVSLFDTHEGEKTIHWVVGENVDRETYERLKDDQGKLHVVAFYRHGEKEAYVTTREEYAKQREAVANAFEVKNLRDAAEQGSVDA